MTTIYNASTNRPTTRVLFVIIIFVAAAWYVLRSSAPQSSPTLTVAEPIVNHVTTSQSPGTFTVSLPNDDGGETAVTYSIVGEANGVTTLRSEIGSELTIATGALTSDAFWGALEELRAANGQKMLDRYVCSSATVTPIGNGIAQRIAGCRGMQ